MRQPGPTDRFVAQRILPFRQIGEGSPMPLQTSNPPDRPRRIVQFHWDLCGIKTKNFNHHTGDFKLLLKTFQSYLALPALCRLGNCFCSTSYSFSWSWENGALFLLFGNEKVWQKCCSIKAYDRSVAHNCINRFPHLSHTFAHWSDWPKNVQNWFKTRKKGDFLIFFLLVWNDFVFMNIFHEFQTSVQCAI